MSRLPMSNNSAIYQQGALEQAVYDHELWLSSLGNKGTRLELIRFDVLKYWGPIYTILESRDLSNCVMIDCSFRHTLFFNTNLEGATLTRCDFNQGGFELSNLSNSTITDCSWEFAWFYNSTRFSLSDLEKFATTRLYQEREKGSFDKSDLYQSLLKKKNIIESMNNTFGSKK